ncbi:MAG: hypothetical protein AB8B51_10440 [Sedimentitalea sp.]
MSDFTTTQSRGSLGWIIGAIAVVLVLLFIIFGAGIEPVPGDGIVLPEAGAVPADPAPAVVD